MRTQHTPHSLPGFPVYSSAFLSDTELVLGGGGGAGRNGVRNQLRLYQLHDDRQIDLMTQVELAPDEDAPMSMDADTEKKLIICGVNSASTLLEKGENQNCRQFSFKDGSLTAGATKQTLNGDDREDYQRVTILSPDKSQVFVSGHHDFVIASSSSLNVTATSKIPSDISIYDASFSPSSDTLVVTTDAELLVYGLSSAKSSTKKRKKATPSSLQASQSIPPPSLPDVTAGSDYRSTRFHPSEDETAAYSILNSKPGARSRDRNAKAETRRGFIVRWDTGSWDIKTARKKKISDKGLTCFDVSPSGNFLAYGSSDLSVGILDSRTLGPLLNILHAHEFPPTTLRFNPSSALLISGSADTTIRVAQVPTLDSGSTWSSTMIVVMILTILTLIVAFLYGRSEVI